MREYSDFNLLQLSLRFWRVVGVHTYKNIVLLSINQLPLIFNGVLHVAR